jgi:hypothetical protein
MKAHRLFFVAVLLLIPEVALPQEDFGFLPPEVGNGWRYGLTYTGPGEPIVDFISEENPSIDGVVRWNTSAVSLPGEVEELPVSDGAERVYLSSGSLSHFIADFMARWGLGDVYRGGAAHRSGNTTVAPCVSPGSLRRHSWRPRAHSGAETRPGLDCLPSSDVLSVSIQKGQSTYARSGERYLKALAQIRRRELLFHQDDWEILLSGLSAFRR